MHQYNNYISIIIMYNKHFYRYKVILIIKKIKYWIYNQTYINRIIINNQGNKVK
jgi:hypothetical protein